jgi:lysozyme
MKIIDYIAVAIVSIFLIVAAFVGKNETNSDTKYIHSRNNSLQMYIDRIQEMVDKISHDGLRFIQQYEGLKLHAYKPHADDVWTIGYGTTRINGRPVTPDLKITRAQALDYFRQDLVKFENAVKRRVEVELEQEQFDALVSFVYNVGEGNFARSTLLKKLNKGDFEGAAKEFPKWRRSGGKILLGLERRRAAEAKMFSQCLIIEDVKEKKECLNAEKELENLEEPTKTLALDLSEKPEKNNQSKTTESDSLDS